MTSNTSKSKIMASEFTSEFTSDKPESNTMRYRRLYSHGKKALRDANEEIQALKLQIEEMKLQIEKEPSKDTSKEPSKDTSKEPSLQDIRKNKWPSSRSITKLALRTYCQKRWNCGNLKWCNDPITGLYDKKLKDERMEQAKEFLLTK